MQPFSILSQSMLSRFGITRRELETRVCNAVSMRANQSCNVTQIRFTLYDTLLTRFVRVESPYEE